MLKSRSKNHFSGNQLLLDRGAIALLEELNDKYKPKIVRTVHLVIKEEQLSEVIEKTQKAPKQLAVLQSYLQQKSKHPEQSVKTADLVCWASLLINRSMLWSKKACSV